MMRGKRRIKIKIRRRIEVLYGCLFNWSGYLLGTDKLRYVCPGQTSKKAEKWGIKCW